MVGPMVDQIAGNDAYLHIATYGILCNISPARKRRNLQLAKASQDLLLLVFIKQQKEIQYFGIYREPVIHLDP